MPLYEYRRPDGSTFEVIQKFSDDALTVDPDTGVPVKRVLSAPAIHFKGSGFHNTDYGTRKRNNEKASHDAANSSSSGSESGSTASKGESASPAPAPKSDTSGGSSSSSGGSGGSD